MKAKKHDRINGGPVSFHILDETNLMFISMDEGDAEYEPGCYAVAV